MAAGTGDHQYDDRYWIPQTVNVSGVAPGSSATFMVRVWTTSSGSYEAALTGSGGWGYSASFSITVGGGGLPPADLVGLQAFQAGIYPEPSILTLGGLGVVILRVSRRKGRCELSLSSRGHGTAR